jgi:hypothetical protein
MPVGGNWVGGADHYKVKVVKKQGVKKHFSPAEKKHHPADRREPAITG